MIGAQMLLQRSSGALNLGLWGYSIAWMLYLGDALREDRRLEKAASTVFWAAFGFHTLSLLCRWLAGGWMHPPWASLYEILVFVSWAVVAVRLQLEVRLGFRHGPFFVILSAILAIVIGRLNQNRALDFLQPALQSRWLLVHVPVAALAYGLFLLAGSFSFFHLVRDRVRTDSLQLGASGLGLLTVAVMVAADFYVEGAPNLRWLPGPGTGSILGFGIGAWLAHWTVGSFSHALLAPVTLAKTQGSAAGWLGERGERLDLLQLGLRLSFAGGTLCLVIFCAAMIAMNGSDGEFRLLNHPFRFAGLLGVTIIGALVLFISHGRGELEKKLPSAVRLDRMSYQCTLAGFGMMTLTLVTGAAWAFQAWGRYWSWDPKEVWALVTWLYYAIALHNRLIGGWTSRKMALFTLFGLAVVLFTFLGVNILIVGIHAFATR